MCVGTLWNNYIKKPHNQRTKKIQRIKLNRNECTAKYTTLVIINVASMMRTRMLLCVFFAFLFFPLFPCGAIILCWFPFYFSLSCVYRDRLVCWIAVQLYLIPVCFVQLDFKCVRIFTFYLPFSSSKTFSRFCSILQFTWCYYDCNFNIPFFPIGMPCFFLLSQKSNETTTTIIFTAWEKSNYFILFVFLSCFNLALFLPSHILALYYFKQWFIYSYICLTLMYNNQIIHILLIWP